MRAPGWPEVSIHAFYYEQTCFDESSNIRLFDGYMAYCSHEHAWGWEPWPLRAFIYHIPEVATIVPASSWKDVYIACRRILYRKQFPHPPFSRGPLLPGREGFAAHALTPSPHPNYRMGVPPRNGFCGGEAAARWRVMEGLNQASIKASSKYWVIIQEVKRAKG